MDKRPEALIRMGAVLNAIEPLEAELDGFLIAMADVPRVLWNTKRELLFARHNAFGVRCRMIQLLDRMEGSVYWLKDARNMMDGISSLTSAAEGAKALLENVMTANAVFGQGICPPGEESEYQAVWTRIVDRAGELPTKIDDAKKALTVASLALHQ